MLNIPFYQTEWLGIDLTKIANQLSLDCNQIANSSFYTAFYQKLKKDNILPSTSWIRDKKHLANQITNFLIQYSSVDNASILSIGSGFGVVELELYNYGFKIDLQECQEYSLSHLKNNKNLKIIISNDLSGIKSDSYDMVMAITSTYCLNIKVLEQFLLTISRILKNNGVFIWYETSLTYYDILQYIKRLVYNKLKGIKQSGVLWGWKRSMITQVRIALQNKFSLLEKVYFDNHNNVICPKVLFEMLIDQTAVWQMGIYKNIK